MNVRFATNIGSRHAQQLGLDLANCKEGDTVDLPESKVEEIRAVCGPASIIGVSSRKEAKAEPSEADLEKLTAPEKKK
jgi:hypothetical protein